MEASQGGGVGRAGMGATEREVLRKKGLLGGSVVRVAVAAGTKCKMTCLFQKPLATCLRNVRAFEPTVP